MVAILDTTRSFVSITLDERRDLASAHAVAQLCRAHGPTLFGVGDAPQVRYEAPSCDAANDLATARALADLVEQLNAQHPPMTTLASSVADTDGAVVTVAA